MSGENDVRYLQQDASDANILYATTNTAPGRLVKLDKATMSRVGGVTLSEGEWRMNGSTYAYNPNNDTQAKIFRWRD